MTHPTTSPAVADLLAAFVAAPDERLEEEFLRLAGTVWSADGPVGGAAEHTPALVAALDGADARRTGHLAVLLGLLAESEYREHPAGDGPVRTAVHRGLDRYLELLAGSGAGTPLTTALLYLLAHFPEDRARILTAASVDELLLDEHDLTRLERALRALDPDDPDLGRCWPSPAAWNLNEDERGFDKASIKALAPEQIVANWNNDTRTVLAYAGMKAYWAVRHGAALETSYPAPAAQSAEAAAELGPQAFARHADALRCPSCDGGLDYTDGVRCAACATAFPLAQGLLDLSRGATGSQASEEDDTADLLQKLAAMPSMGVYYETVLRPAFLRIAGLNWDDAVTPADEDAYLLARTRPVDGPVLDLCAGAGRWTAVLEQAVGTDRLIAQDLGLPMLTALRRALPEVPAVVASALTLPYGDATFGAVNCWNALQAFPEQAGIAIAEIGRVLKPGGTFTLLTFRWADDPVDRYFQGSHFFPSRPAGMLLFELDEIAKWLADAGLTIREQSGTGSFVFITAERTPQG
ncbi:methyltransferase domain-containing protein [Streptomyces spongiicola]|uniref:Class I SAM-dependent methyltransferase n=1 Tax=Streptomyces spongiicola TaxID=1690221 RepID=A0A2S1Z3N6_9ACTN|nr:class I SAM-dependent methyltransferase [Streptomyces spongiicola]AWK10977.1 class I SAM-dependent methyltransferase [Streptomyces spongiicola]GBQ03553.1 methyltransferase domain-containing protein [Streptomyces spongiicola]